MRVPTTNHGGTVRVGHVYMDVPRRLFHYLNPTARQLRDEGVPMTSLDPARAPLLSLAGEPATAADLPLLRAYREGKPVEAQFLLPRSGGPRWRVSWTAAPLRGESGRIVGVLGTVVLSLPGPDGQELAELAHDLGAPLQSLGLLCSVIDQLPAGEEVRTAVGTIRAAAERALQIGRQLLDRCRGPAPRRGPSGPGWFALEPFLEGLVREQAPAAQRKGLELRSDLAAVRGWEALVDRVRLGRLLANLLVNAVRYTGRGRIELSASWREEAGGRLLALGIVDTGPGISDEDRESIFHPFERGQAGKDSDSGGSGLGLTVVDRLVAELGLSLDVYSEYGHGSAFYVLVPAALLRPAEAPTQTV